MTKATTVAEIMSLAESHARAQGITEQEALDNLAEQYEMICFLGMWDDPTAEVLVPDSLPVAAIRFPAGIIIY